MTNVTMSEELAKGQAMDQTVKILAEVRHFIESNKLNKSKIAEAVGLRQQHISRMTSGKHIPTLYSLLLLIKGVEIVVGYEFESASFIKSYPALKP